MKILRFETDQIQACYGWLAGDRVGKIDGDPFGEHRRLDPEYPVTTIRLLPPVLPSKIICVGRNYEEHAREHGVVVSDMPLLFLKPPSALLGISQPIILPPQSTLVEHEAELAVVIGKKCRWINPENASQYIFGYTIGNDVTARDLQRRDQQWTRGKGFDTFCPLGPWIETDFDPSDALITCHVDKELRQMASTRDMIFTVEQIITFAASIMTLMPGDVILTGTPAGVGALFTGNVVKITIDGIGTLSNPVLSDPSQGFNK